MSTSTDITDILFPWNDEEFRANPYPWYERARRESPVYKASDGTFVVTRYDDAMHYGRLPCMSIIEPETGEEDPHPWRVFGSTVLWLDPPDHTRMRRLTNKWFTPKLVRQWTETTREAIDTILDGIAPGQEVDAHLDLGLRPTHTTMCKILDMPEGDMEGMFWALWDAMLIHASDPVAGIKEKSVAGLQFMFDRTRAELEKKLQNPGTGLIDDLLGGYRCGDLTWDEVLGTAVMFYMSGGPNPAYLIGSGFRVFAERPDVMREFRDNPGSRGKIVNELARLNPVELIITRFPTEDIEIRGVHIPAGSAVKFPIGAANRDPETFADPDHFDMNRPPEASRNLTFSLGTHTCAGQLISLAETEAILAAVAERYTRVELLREPIEVRTDRLVIFDKLPVVLH